jgi:hypothetical protein
MDLSILLKDDMNSLLAIESMKLARMDEVGNVVLS